MRAAFEPVDDAGLRVLDKVTVSWQWPINCSLIKDQLHILHPAIELCVEVSRKRRERDLVLLVVLIFPVYNVNRVSKDTPWGEKPVDKLVPVGQIILTLRALGRIST